MSHPTRAPLEPPIADVWPDRRDSLTFFEQPPSLTVEPFDCDGDTDTEARSAVEKACELLIGVCGNGNITLGVSELARRAGLAKSTAHRQLNTLERAGMVERSERGYRVGRRLRAVAHDIWRVRYGPTGDLLLPFLVELFVETGHTVQLAVLDDLDVLYLGKLCRHRSAATRARVGARLPAHCTAGGKALLAYQPGSLAELRRTAPLRSMTPASVCDPIRLAAEFTSIRARGVAVEKGESTPGVWCVSMPIFAAPDTPVAAISISTPRGTNFAIFAEVLRRITIAASRTIARESPL